MPAKSILIIENAPNWHNLYKQMLEDYNLTIVGTHRIALELLEKSLREDTFDLVITNINLIANPEIERDRMGVKILNWLREHNYPSPCIVVTGDEDPEISRWIKDYHVQEVFIKGHFRAGTLIGRIEQCLTEGKPRRGKVFISYSHKDEVWLNSLLTYLKPLLRDGTIEVWTDRTELQVGDVWSPKIKEAIDGTKVGVFLVSPHFLASDFIDNNELKPLLEAATRKEATIFWVSVSHCLYKETEFAKYQCANNPSKPLDTLSKGALGKTLVDICQKIKALA